MSLIDQSKKGYKMYYDEQFDSYTIEIKGIIFECDEIHDHEYINHLNKISNHHYHALDDIIKFMMPDLEIVYGKLDKEFVKEKFGKPTIHYDNGTVQYLEQIVDDFYIFEFEFLDDNFKEL